MFERAYETYRFIYAIFSAVRVDICHWFNNADGYRCSFLFVPQFIGNAIDTLSNNKEGLVNYIFILFCYLSLLLF